MTASKKKQSDGVKQKPSKASSTNLGMKKNSSKVSSRDITIDNDIKVENDDLQKHNNHHNILKLRIIQISLIVLVLCSSLLLLDGIGILLCGKDDFNAMVKGANAPVFPTRYVDENGPRKKIKEKEKHSDGTILEASPKTCDPSPTCKNVAYILKKVTSILPISYFPTSLNQNEQHTVTTSTQESIGREGFERNNRKKKDHPLKCVSKGFASFFRKFKKNPKPQLQTSRTCYATFTSSNIEMAKRLAKNVREEIDDTNFDARMKAVRWGGPEAHHSSDWWELQKRGAKIDREDGVRLMLAYLKIMLWPNDFMTIFPFDYCNPKTCHATFAVIHSLEYREKFKPWLVTPSVIQENRYGFIFVHGHSPDHGNQLGPSLVFLRPGLHSVENVDAYVRIMVNTFEIAVAETLLRSSGRLGVFNVLLDSTDFKLANVGGIHTISYAKRLFRILKDHFPDRVNHLYLTNLGRPAALFIKMVSPFIAEDFHEKIHVIPKGNEDMNKALLPLIGEEFIPMWLGGKDDYEFNVDDYYRKKYGHLIASEEEGLEYKTTMPYHAK